VRKQHDGELGRVEAILARLASDDRAILEPVTLPRWLRRRRRLAERDAAVIDARQRFFPGRHVTVAAKRLALALRGYRDSNWRWERYTGVPAVASERHRALYRILSANGGAALRWRRIVDILNS
jgi:hypothetical protein